MSETTKQKFRIESQAPEGGWGYLVAFGMGLPLSFGLGSLASFGLIYGEFLAKVGGTTSSVTIIIGTFFCASSFAGLFISTLHKKFSTRSVAIFGAVIYFLGNFMAIFVNSVEHVIVTFGVLQGTGFGLMVPTAFTVFNQYFIVRRLFVMSLAQTFIGFLMMLYPIAVDYFKEMYGFRGLVAIFTALSGHNILGMIMMHPIAWHCKMIQIQSEPLMDANTKNCDDEKKEVSIVDFKLTELPNNIKNETRLSIPSTDFNENRIAGDSIAMKIGRSKSLDPTKYADFVAVKQRMPSLMSLGDWNGAAVLGESCEDIKDGKWQKVVDFLDLSLLKDIIYLNMVLGVSCALYSDNSFFTLLPLYLFELKFSQREAAIIVAAAATADLGARIFLAIISYFISIKARHIYLIGAAATIFVRFVFLTIYDFTGMLSVIGVMGFFRTFVHMPLALVFGEYLPLDRFASGYGLFVFFQGNFAFLIGPFIGWIRDVTQSFTICFHSLTFIMALCAVPWLIEIIWLRVRPRKNQI